MMKRCELLAPAGSFDAACAAFAFGADAIYLGLRSLSARAEAVNFTPDELRSICAYARSLTPRRSVYVTVNTLFRDQDLRGAADVLRTVAEAGADAAIVQDLAVAAIARRVAPSLRLHASTQMFVHSAEGAAAVRELGFSRVVLARELTFAEVAGITATAGIETEVFIQGALCYGYSGQCLFSAIATGRSGNRGQCAYCCRGRFSAPGQPAAFPFSMRDLALGRDVRRLRDAGVASLKIEGRMKSPLYVAAATRLYRLILDGQAGEREIAEARDDLLTVFSRPATSLYFGGANPPERIIDPETVGHRGCPVGKVEGVSGPHGARRLRLTPTRPIERHDGLQIDLPGRPYGFAVESLRLPPSGREAVSAPAGVPVEVALPQDAPRLPVGAAVCCASSQAAKRRLAFDRPRAADLTPTRPVDVTVVLAPDSISASATLHGAEVSASIPAELGPARNPAATEAAVQKAFGRMGAAQWRARSVNVSDPQSLFAPASLLNDLRRSLCDSLDARDADVSERRFSEAMAGVGDWLSRPLDDASGVPEGLSVKVPFASKPRSIDCAEVVLSLARADCRSTEAMIGRLAEWRRIASRVRLALPLLVRNADAPAVEAAVSRMAAIGVADWEVGELSMLRLVRRVCGERLASLTANASLYALNAAAARELRRLGIAAAVIPAEADAEDARTLCAGDSGFFIANAESRPPLFVSETRPLAPGCGGADKFTLVDAHGAGYEVRREDVLWVTRQTEVRRVEVPSAARRIRKDLTA